MQARVVVHLDWDRMDELEMGLGNIRDLLKDIPASEAEALGTNRFVRCHIQAHW